MRTWWMGLFVVVASMGCRTEDERTVGEQRDPAVENRSEPTAPPIDTQQRPRPEAQRPAPAVPAPEPRAAATAPPADAAGVMLGSAIVCRPTAVVEESVERTIRFADTNQDGRLSQQEAASAMDLVVGGFFFRADENADGTVTPEEARKTRSDLYEQYPAIAAIFGTIRDATGQSAFASVAKMLDIDYGAPLSIREAREAARRSVTQAFAAIDADRNGEVRVEEARAAADEGARALGRATFDAADANKDGALTQDELRTAMQRATDMAFDAADADNDGRLTREEAARGIAQLSRQVEVERPPRQR